MDVIDETFGRAALMEEFVERAFHLAKAAHGSTRNKHNGETYFKHPVRVARNVSLLATPMGTEEGSPQYMSAKAVAWLHDAVEDTWLTYEMVEQAFAEPEAQMIRSGVLAMTRPPGQTYVGYIRALKGNPVARLVKAADLMDNTEPARLAELAIEKREYLAEKYAEAMEILDVKEVIEQCQKQPKIW